MQVERRLLDDPSGYWTFFSGNPLVEVLQGEIISFQDQNTSGTVLVKGVPCYLSIAEFCSFVGAYIESVAHLRILRGKTDPDIYGVLMLFNTVDVAVQFREELNGREFSSISPHSSLFLPVGSEKRAPSILLCPELFQRLAFLFSPLFSLANSEQTEVCEIDFVEKVVFKGDASTVTLWPPSPSQKDASCSICLERLDQSGTGGLVTILCNHSFHSSCLCQWRKENRCPICRYSQTPSGEQSLCSVCGIEEDLWMCLICGHDHFLETKHTYSLELDTQKVWDYTKDAFIHRLALNTDGKIVEIPNYSQEQELGNIVKRDDLFLDEALALEWQYLASAQIETQRSYFEDQLRNLKRQNKGKIAYLEEEFNQLLREKTQVAHQLETVRDQKKFIEKKTDSLQKQLTEMSKETLFLRTINEALEKNKEGWLRKAKEVEEQAQMSPQDLRIQELETKVAELMKVIEQGQG